MSNEKFTKGPWKVFSLHPSQSVFTIAPKQKPYDLFGTLSVKDEVCCAYNVKSNVQDNLSIIAAAPEMYEMLDYLCGLDENQMSRQDIEKLLAKARGER